MIARAEGGVCQLLFMRGMKSMKPTKLATIIGLSFAFVTGQLSATASKPANTQDRRQPEAVAGTRWEGTIYPASGFLIVQIVEFLDSGKVVMSFVTASLGKADRIQINSSAPGPPEEERGRWNIVTGTPVQILDTRTEVGTYKQNGGSIQLEFADRRIDATLRGTTMEGAVVSKNSQTRERWLVGKKSSSSALGNDTLSSVFRVSADSPLLGTWKHEEYSPAIDIAGSKSRPTISKIVTASFSQDGILEIAIQEGFVKNLSFLKRTEKTNWKYLPNTVSSGVLEQYQGEVISKGNIRWISRTQFEYTVAFHRDSRRVGERQNYTWQSGPSLSVSPATDALAPTFSLSMIGRLPTQLGEFKRINVRNDCYDPRKGKQNDESATAGELQQLARNIAIDKVCAQGDVELYVAVYGKAQFAEISVEIERHLGSAKAAQNLKATIDSTTRTIAKRELVADRAGRTVGESVLLHSAREDHGEVLLFTFGVYSYTIVAVKRGDAQAIVKLLPLE